jgi:DNA-binding CsgD family transcriptional regulator
VINPRFSDDPQLKAALRVWDSANSLWDKTFDESMRIRTTLRDTSSHQAFGWAALTGGRIAAYRGDVDRAEILLTEALGRFYLVGDTYGEGMAISHLAIPQVIRRNLDRALEFALRPLSSNVPFSDHDRFMLHNGAAMCYWAREESHHAIAHLVKTYDLVKNSGDLERSAAVLGNMGVVLLRLGEWGLALSVSTKAWRLQLNACADRKRLQLSQLSNIVHLNFLLENHDAALSHAEHLLTLLSPTNDPATSSHFLELVNAFSVNGEIEKARLCLDRARTLSANDRTGYSSAHLLLGEAILFEGSKDYYSAISLAKQVLDQPIEIVKREVHLGATLVLSRSYRALGRNGEAMKWQRSANEVRHENPLSDILSSQIRARVQIEQPSQPLTERELACLSLAAHGQTSADIALKLGIKTRTVNYHIDKTLRKLNAINRQEAIAKATSANLLHKP